MRFKRQSQAIRIPSTTYARFVEDARFAGQTLMDFQGSLLAAWEVLSPMAKAKALQKQSQWKQEEARKRRPTQ